MGSRPEASRWLVTLTIDPKAYGAVRIGTSLWDDGRETALWSEPTRDQFEQAVRDMAKAWDRMTRALNARCKRRGLDPWAYFRVTELHRNRWPHYHAVLEHAQLADAPDLELWPLGISDARPVSIDDAVGELAPYLVATEAKAGGSKAYQFAALALPKGFRLYSASRGFLGPRHRDDDQLAAPEHALVLRGHFTGYHHQAREWGADSRLLLPTPAAPDRPHRPPSTALATGDAAVVLFAELAHAHALHVEASQLRVGWALNPETSAIAEGRAPPRARPALPPPPVADELLAD
jgi:hypothetical protein